MVSSPFTQTDATGSSLAYHKIPPFIISTISYIGGCHFSNVPLKMKFLRKMIGKKILGVIQYLWDIQMQPYRIQCK